MLNWQIAIVCIDLAIVLLTLIAFRFGMSSIIGVHAKNELDKKDNFSFGISVAGGTLAIMLIMSGAISGVASGSLMNEAINVLMYGVVGVVLLKVGFLIQDKVLLRGVSLSDQVKEGNWAAGVIVAANLISIGVIIKGAISWIEDDGMYGLLPVAIVFVASQIVLAGVTALRLKVFSSRNDGKSWQVAISEGNGALSLRFAGQLLATALAITASGSLIDYSSTLLLEVGVTWLAISFGVMLVVWLIYKLMIPIILSKINIVQEVDVEKNVGVAAIEASIFIGIASLIISFLS